MRLHLSHSLPIAIALFFSIIPAISYASGLNSNRLAIIVEALPSSSDSDDSERLSFALGLALGNYVDYYLSRSDIEYQLFQSESSPPPTELFALIHDSGFVNIITLRPTGKFTTVHVPMLSRNRRLYHESVGSQLNLQISYRMFDLQNDKRLERSRGKIKVKAKRRWFIPPVGLTERRVDSLVAVTPEPVEFVIMRGVGTLMERLGITGNNRNSINDNESLDDRKIATIVVVDSLITHESENWQQSIETMLRYLDQSFSKQFGTVIEISGIEVARLGSNRIEPLTNSFTRLKQKYPIRKDGITIGIHSERRPINFFRLREFDAVGLSARGDGQLLVKAFPPTRDEMEYWRPFLTARSCLHELGHVYGAIHVSDLKSIMNHSATWLSTFRFDALNRQIVEAATNGSLDVSNNFAYARFVADAIESSHYNLADFPPLFFNLISNGKINHDDKRNKNERISTLFQLAADGYGALRAREMNKAADYFRRAILLAPNQAALHYYLSFCTRGGEAVNSLKRAASLGYELARESMRRPE